MPSMPDRSGHYGAFGGRYVSETLMPALARARGGISGVAARSALPGRAAPHSDALRRPADAALFRRESDASGSAARRST